MEYRVGHGRSKANGRRGKKAMPFAESINGIQPGLSQTEIVWLTKQVNDEFSLVEFVISRS